MTSNIYIIADGNKTKIGISKKLDSRMSTYDTHNPNYKLMYNYVCSETDAKRIESLIKIVFKKDLCNSNSKEWFNVDYQIINRFTLSLLGHYVNESFYNNEYTIDNILRNKNKNITSHGVELNDESFAIKDKLFRTIDINEKIKLKDELIKIFAEKYNLGIPENKLPNKIILKVDLCLDYLQDEIKVNKKVLDSINNNQLLLTENDDQFRFYHLVKLNTDYFIAICTSLISQPKLSIFESELKHTVIEEANNYGLYCSFHNQWSWLKPFESALAIYQPKTDLYDLLSSWENSFKKWVVERGLILKNLEYKDRNNLSDCIDYIIKDNFFPTNILNFNNLENQYINKFFNSNDKIFQYKDVFIYLINIWNENKTINPANKIDDSTNKNYNIIKSFIKDLNVISIDINNTRKFTKKAKIYNVFENYCKDNKHELINTVNFWKWMIIFFPSIKITIQSNRRINNERIVNLDFK